MSLSINVWVFGGLSGIDYYRIDPAVGTSNSLKVYTVESMDLSIGLGSLQRGGSVW